MTIGVELQSEWGVVRGAGPQGRVVWAGSKQNTRRRDNATAKGKANRDIATERNSELAAGAYRIIGNTSCKFENAPRDCQSAITKGMHGN